MTWDLTKLYAGIDDPAISRDLDEAVSCAGRAAQALDGEPEPRAKVREALKALSAGSSLLMRAGQMAFLTTAVEAENARAQALYNRAQAVSNEFTPVFSALSNRLGNTPDLDALIGEDPYLREHAYALRKLKERATHTIDPALEKTVLTMQLTGGRAFSQLRDLLDGTHLIEVEKDGAVKSLPLSEVRGMAYSPDAAVRRRAYEAELASYPRMEHAMAACLSAIKGEGLTMAGLKKYESPLDWMLDEARMDRPTLAALLSAMEKSLPAFRRYFRAKGKALGHEGGLPFYDLFAPMGGSEVTYTLEEARALIAEVLGTFSPEMAAFVNRAFDERWIDAYPKAGKTGGAFCAGVHPLRISYILSNFEGSFSSVSTLAHELGHAFHNECLKENSVLNADYPMPLAETASIFNETLLTGTIMDRLSGEALIPILEQQVCDAAQVVVDILSRYLFETRVFEIRKDRPLPAAELKELMLQAQRETYGEGLDENFLHPYMWACKSHYYSPDFHFYNYPYAFGLLFGKGVYARYRQRGPAFAPEYKALLRATAVGDVADVAASVGIDVRDEGFWLAALEDVEREIDRLVELLEARG